MNGPARKTVHARTSPEHQPSARRALRLALAMALGVGLSLCAVVVFAPGTALGQWLSTRLLLAQALAFPLVTGGGGILLGLAVLAAAVVSRARQRVRLGALVAALVVLGAGLVAFPAGPPWATGPGTAAGNTGRPLRVTVFNSLDTLTAADARRIIETHDPDVLVLPEATPARAAAALAGTAYAGRIHESPDAGFSEGRPPWVAPTTLAIHPRAGAYRSGAPVPTTFGAVRLDPPPGTAEPTIIGGHTAPPLPRMMGSWRADLARLREVDAAATHGPLIVAGDLNATLRHGPLAGLQHLADTAQRCPEPAGGTWPASAPAGLRSPIDHVLVTPDVEVLSCATLRVGESDHLAYSVELRLPGA